MFNNLIESNKHTDDFKRKGSFFLATTIAYALFLMSAGVASVLAYDTHLENQSLELVALLSPVPIAPKPEVQKQLSKPAKSNEQKASTRTEFIARVDTSTKAPEKISSEANKTPEMPKNGKVAIGPTNTDAISSPTGPSYSDNSGNNETASNNRQIVPDTEQPPPVVKELKAVKPPTVISKGVINGIAVYLHKPAYPTIAKTAGAKGEVKVQVLIDENGKVISASTVSGHPLLKATAVQAALQSRFTPTQLSNVPVKVSGFIVYNFTF